jgi:hypothetical protein
VSWEPVASTTTASTRRKLTLLAHLASHQVLEGYMLQGLSGKQMAQKVLTCFKDAIHDNCTKVRPALHRQTSCQDCCTLAAWAVSIHLPSPTAWGLPLVKAA